MNGSSSRHNSEIADAERYVEVAVLCVITTVSVVANFLLWMVILGTRSLRGESNNKLLLSLSLADIFVSVVSMPITVVSIYMGRWIFSEQMCTVLGFLNMLTLVSSVMSLGLISINRYIKICRPNQYRAVYTSANILLMTLGVWCLSAVLSSPPLYGWCVYVYLPRQSFCFCDWSTSTSYTFFMVTACFGGPLLMMAASNIRILQTYRNSQRRLQPKPSERLQHQPGGQLQHSVVTELTAVETSNKNLALSSVLPSAGAQPADRAVPPASVQGVFTLPDIMLQTTASQHDGQRSTDGDVAHHNGTAGTVSYTDLASLEGTTIAPLASADARPHSGDVNTSSVVQSREADSRQPAATLSVPVSKGTGKRPTSASTVDLSVRQKRKEKRRAEEFQLALSLMVVIVAFVLCWLPFCVTMLLSVFYPESLVRAADMFTLLLGYSSSCLNPIIYGVMNKRVKEGYSTLWKKLCFYRLFRRGHKTTAVKTMTRCSETQS